MTHKNDTAHRLRMPSRERQELSKAVEATREAFKDVPTDEIEGEIARAIAEDRAQRQEKRAKEAQAPQTT